MPKLQPFEQIDAGGVDSRSNPVNMPRNRALRCLNWAPRQAGFWEQRWGYSSVSMSTVSASAISGMFPYLTFDGHKYVIFMQGTTFKTLDTSTGTVTTPTVLGNSISSSAKGMGYFANNRFHYGNGTDQKWFDGSNWRDNGLAALGTADVLSVAVVEGVRELTATQASTITLSALAGGSFPADTLSGRLIYVAIFDTTAPSTVFGNEVGPATISVGSGRIKVALNNKITVANMPDLSGVNPNWVKLIGGTVDGGNVAYFFTNTSTNLTSCTRVGQTLTVTATAHGLSTGDVAIIAGTTNFDGVYAVTNTGANTFTLTLPITNNGTNTGAVGTVKRIVKAANATTTVDVLANTTDTSYQVNQNRGLPASTIGGTNAGYQFYASLYKPNGGGHVGNRFPIGSRALQTAYRTNWRISGTAVSADAEAYWLIGRTGDGAQVPYVCQDPVGNFATVFIGGLFSYVTLTQGDIGLELPTRNGVIPSQCNMFCVAGDFCYAGDTGSPYLRRSGDLSQAIERGNSVLGRPEQSWAPNDIDTFPTGEALTGMFEVDQEVLCGTQNDTAVSVNLAGVQQWIGPWPVGIAGRRAGTKCGAHGFFWVTTEKQLATLTQGVPIGVSDEYELAELAQIGDSFLSTVECAYYRNVSQNKDELRIEAQKQDGTPYTIIHDFKLRETYSAPGSLYGQGYSSQFTGQLSSAFTVAKVRDGSASGALRMYAGGANGQIYQLYSGADDAGTQFTSDLILLINGGPDRPNVPFFDFCGDQNIKVTAGRNFQTSLANGAQFGFDPPNSNANVAQTVPDAPYDFLYRVRLVPPEVQRIYLRFQLTSHSGDGNLNLNSPPHVPLENYGRLYEIVPAIGDVRDK
jgi:hypothetical protein